MPAQPTQPAQPPESAQSTQPAQLTESPGPTEPRPPAEPSSPLESESSASSVARVEPLEGPTWELKPSFDFPVLALEVAAASAWLLGPQLAPAYCAPLCDRNSVWAIDRFSAGWYRPAWRLTSDLGVATLLLGSITTLLVDEGFVAGLSDLVIVAEALAGALALANLSNISSRRPRPLLYGGRAPLEMRENGSASFSFFSGHTASSFALTFATFVTLRERHPNAVGPWIALGVGLAGSVLVSAGRLASGYHFLTDVLVGAGVGTAIGFLVPALHSSRFRVSAFPIESGAQLQLTGFL